MSDAQPPATGRIRRLADELAEHGFPLGGDDAWRALVLGEIADAMHPAVHERRVPSVGSIVEPQADPQTWQRGTDLAVSRQAVSDMELSGARRFADGLSSWLVRRVGGDDEWVVFDRPAGSERDLTVLADAWKATVVQRHPTGVVRVVGEFGTMRWEGWSWHHEPPIDSWVDAVAACPDHGDREVLRQLLEFAVHDLGSLGIGAIIVYRPDDPDRVAVPLGLAPAVPISEAPAVPISEERLPIPPPLQIRRAADLAPLRHALAQVDGAAFLDASGTLRRIGVRLVPSRSAESVVDGYRGMRHTAARRYSRDDPGATVVVVSEDGPVTVLRDGAIVGASPSPSG